MPRDIRIIQLAAYGSNLGDNANIVGLRSMLARNLGEFRLSFTDWEMLDYSWGLRVYDDADIERVNSHDLLIIGGGGFFEIVTASNTWTGTRIAIPYELFRKIRVPVVFHGIGSHAVRAGPAAEGIARFKVFLDLLFSSDQYLVSTRNDGSLRRLRHLVGDAYAERFHVVPDGGFFTEVGDFTHPELPAGGRAFAINFGGDLLGIRFPVVPDAAAPKSSQRAEEKPFAPVVPTDYETFRSAGQAGFDAFLSRFSRVMTDFLVRNDDLRLVCIPHIYRDIDASYHFIHKMGFPFARRRIVMAPYLNGRTGQDYIFDLYRKCALTIGMRLHANVVPIGLGVPSIGLSTLPMTAEVYRECGIAERALNPNDEDFEDRLRALVESSLADPGAIRRQYAAIRSRLADQAKTFHRRIAALL